MRRTRWGDGGGGDDGGFATVWTAIAVMAFCAVFALLLAMGQAVLARHRAGGAADLAVLAAADHALLGEETACGFARRVAGAQRARVVTCAVRGEIAEVAAEARAGPYAVRVRSRAGPATADVPAVTAGPVPEGSVPDGDGASGASGPEGAG
ncbi:flp pilus-assembly TadE/G-like family protein [Streptomyces sp. AV19]|uniref:Rv3654c family TadE-like protein n=1 Tax=Streptomyces sp. AV19 TaxID=2793068 RepID=UPI0018FE3E46|nr:Rv3654c family TadE-like protein [Streptomyces sp. AV19]MBH1934884.1 flp pilus-assembly TadE/G-like family protein [Streptomyces sp. AV19]MDG4537018.1 flp pilus-assembly TadE/G-like family protein [Streptomyces sp. AV19]